MAQITQNASAQRTQADASSALAMNDRRTIPCNTEGNLGWRMTSSQQAASGQQQANSDMRMARATLISAIIAALAAVAGAIIGPIIVHSLDAESQVANSRQTIYGNFISQANASEDSLISTYNSIAATYTPHQSAKATSHFVLLTSTSAAQFASAEDQLDLVAPSNIVHSARAVDTAMTALDEACVSIIQSPSLKSENLIKLGAESFKHAITSFVHAAR